MLIFATQCFLTTSIYRIHEILYLVPQIKLHLTRCQYLLINDLGLHKMEVDELIQGQLFLIFVHKIVPLFPYRQCLTFQLEAPVRTSIWLLWKFWKTCLENPQCLFLSCHFSFCNHRRGNCWESIWNLLRPSCKPVNNLLDNFRNWTKILIIKI